MELAGAYKTGCVGCREQSQRGDLSPLGKLSVLVRISVAVKRYHDHGNSYKGWHTVSEL